MKRFSRKQLALATLSLMEKHPQKEVVRVLAETLIKEKKTNEIELVVREIGNQLFQTKSELTGTLETASQVSEKNAKEIEHLVKKITNAKQVSFNHKVNKKVIGGFKVTTPNLEIDATLARPLHQLKTFTS